LRKHEPFAVGLSVYEHNFFESVSVAKLLKKANPDIFVIVGGPMPTLLPVSTLLYGKGSFDILLRGDAEFTLRQLMEDRIEKGTLLEVDGLVGIRNGQLTVTERSNTVPSLPADVLGKIDLDFSFFPYEPNVPKGHILTGRGCSFGSCSFCGVAKYRPFSVDATIEAINRALEYYRGRIAIRDPLFGGPKPRLEQILDRMAKLFSERIYVCLSVDQLLENGPVGTRKPDRNIIQKLCRAGITSVELGVENFSDEMLKRIKKGRYTGEEAKKVIFALAYSGLNVHLDLILTDPHTTQKEFLETIESARDIAIISNDDRLMIKFNSPVNPMASPMIGTTLYWEILKRFSKDGKLDESHLAGVKSYDDGYPYFLVRYMPVDIPDLDNVMRIARVRAAEDVTRMKNKISEVLAENIRWSLIGEGYCKHFNKLAGNSC